MSLLAALHDTDREIEVQAVTGWCDQGPPGPADCVVGRLPRACRGGYPARAGGPWLCSTLVLCLFHAVVVPSGLTTQRPAPPVDDHTWWWKGQSKSQSFTEVVPPWALCLLWCTWQAPAGWVQGPAHWQCRSRSSTALPIPAGTVSAYPMSKGRLGPASRTPSSRRRRKARQPSGAGQQVGRP